MKSMTFFSSKSEIPLDEDHLKNFLLNFPEEEIWRLFVERSRNDMRRELYVQYYSVVAGCRLEDAKALSTEEMEKQINHNKIILADLYDIALKKGDINLEIDLDHTFGKDYKNEKLTTLINKHQAWLGFELTEPRYLEHVIKGLQSILFSIHNHDDFNLDFIKNLHKTCTLNVKNMIKQTPGEFRQGRAAWYMNQDNDTRQGLIETINYLKKIEKEFGSSMVAIHISRGEGKTKKIKTFSDKNTEELAKYFRQALRKGHDVIYHVGETGIKTSEFLENICNIHIRELKDALAKAKSKEEKLIAIFTYLKQDVIHHPFKDGTGRTYSMLLLEYLLLRENLSPIIIFDSNFIPGRSVRELVNEYLRGEKEMQEIYHNPFYISSPAFSQHNVNTLGFLGSLNPMEQETFNSCIKIYQGMKENLLDEMEKTATHRKI